MISSNLFFSALDSTVCIQPIFNHSDWLKQDDQIDSLSLPGHSEISLATAISLTDPRKFRIIASRPVQYIHASQDYKFSFKKVNRENDVSYKNEENQDQHFELMETHLTRFYKRLNGSSLLMSEFAVWYEYIGDAKSVDLFEVTLNQAHGLSCTALCRPMRWLVH